MMDRIIRRVEADPNFRKVLESTHAEPERTAADAISAAARQVAHTIGAAGHVSYTQPRATAPRAPPPPPAEPASDPPAPKDTPPRPPLGSRGAPSDPRAPTTLA